MVISLIPNKKKKKYTIRYIKDLSKLYKEILPGLIIFGIVFFGYMGLLFWQGSLKNNLNILQKQKNELFFVSNEERISELRSFASRSRGLFNVLQNHAIPSKSFTVFEESIHPRVVITSYNLLVSAQLLELSGFTTSLDNLGEQFNIWKDESSFVENVILESFSKNSKGQVEFSIILGIEKDFIK